MLDRSASCVIRRRQKALRFSVGFSSTPSSTGLEKSPMRRCASSVRSRWNSGTLSRARHVPTLRRPGRTVRNSVGSEVWCRLATFSSARLSSAFSCMAGDRCGSGPACAASAAPVAPAPALTPPTLTAFAPLTQRLVGVTLCEVIEVGRRRVMEGHRWALVIKRRQIFHQQAKAHGIAGDHIEIDMQAAAPFRQQAQADIAGHTLFQRQQLGTFCGVWRRARLPASLYRRAASRRDAGVCRGREARSSGGHHR